MDDFTTFSLPKPEFESISAEYQAITEQLQQQADAAELDSSLVEQLVNRWDQARREFFTWSYLTDVRFHQDTRNEEYKSNLDYRDELAPKVTDLDVQVQRLLVETQLRKPLEQRFGQQAFALWEKQIASFDPVIESDIVEESKLTNRYNELLASAEFDFEGEQTNISGILKYREFANRDLRYQAEKLLCTWFAENRKELDQIYDQLVKLRQQMSEKLGYQNFVELGYQRMQRIDYDAADVARYREEVRQHIVPLCEKIHQQQAAALNLEELMYWDEDVFYAEGNPQPQGSYEQQIAAAQNMFDEMDESLGSFFQLMQDKNLMDLQNRPGKAGGGFCTDLATEKVPFIFANFNGTQADVKVFTHEIGHAYQCYQSSHLPLYDYLWPTYESCEIHSMGMEFLTWPFMNQFFGDRTEAFCRAHLMNGLLFLPYGVAIDHYQHLVYAKPEASLQERHAMWQEVESLYLADTNYGDLPHVSSGGRWQMKRHVYMSPFYYIDYTLAQCCALQFWALAEKDRDQAMRDYIELCKKGGTLPFQQLTKSVGLKSPFEEGSLAEVAKLAAEYLDL